jgi:hypothetical protein
MLVTAGSGSASRPPERTFRTPGLVLRYPRSWFVSVEPLRGITDPVQRVVLSSYRIPDSGPNAEIAPPRGEVLAQLAEALPPLAGGSWPRRPTRFRLPHLGRMEGFGGNRWGELVFRDRGRRFYLFVGVGRHAPASTIRLLMRSLDTLAVGAAR